MRWYIAILSCNEVPEAAYKSLKCSNREAMGSFKVAVCSDQAREYPHIAPEQDDEAIMILTFQPDKDDKPAALFGIGPEWSYTLLENRITDIVSVYGSLEDPDNGPEA